MQTVLVTGAEVIPAEQAGGTVVGTAIPSGQGVAATGLGPTRDSGYESIRFGVDLVEETIKLHEYLSSVPPVLLRRGPALMQALRRYERYWLPLLAAPYFL